MALFQQVPDNNSVKLILWQFMRYFGTVFCHYAHVRVLHNIIRLIKADLSYLQQQASKGCFLFFFRKFQTISNKILWKFWKVRFKFSLSPYTVLQTDKIAWRKFCSLFLNIIKSGKGRETQNSANSGFSHNFCHWLSERSAKF